MAATTLADSAVLADGGGVASTVAVALPAGRLAPGGSVNVDLVFAVSRGGSYSFVYQPQVAVPAATSSVWAADGGNNSVLEFAERTAGNVAPAVSIAGAATGLAAPKGVAVDPSGRLYVANVSAGTVTEYAPGDTGNVAPAATITGLDEPYSVALDAAGRLYVTNVGDNQVDVFAPGASGAATPLSTITTGVSSPEGITATTPRARCMWPTRAAAR